MELDVASDPGLAFRLCLGALRTTRARDAQAGLRAWGRRPDPAFCASLSAYTGQVDLAARFALRQGAPGAHAVLGLLEPLLDFDGDQQPAAFGGGDCRPWDASVSSLGIERVGDGIDQNCFAGDPSRATVDELANTLRGPDARAAHPRNERVLLLTVDALRYDAELPLTKALLAGRCRKYPGAYATSNMTSDTVYSLMTSRFPSQAKLTWMGPYNTPSQDTSPRLPQVLRDAGFAAAAIAFHTRFDPRLGRTHGFESVWMTGADQCSIQGIAGIETTDRALAWLAEHEGPFFLWVHHYDPHAPYLQHPGVDPRGGSKARYDGEVAFADVQIERLLREMGPTLDDTMIILTGDHGEAFGEHGKTQHASDLFDEQIRVPLRLCPPKGQALPPARAVVSHIDVAPTILDATGVEAPASFLGASLLREGPPRPVFAENLNAANVIHTIVWKGHKLIRCAQGDIRLYYDLATDPAELDPTADADAARVDALEAGMDAWRALLASQGPLVGEAGP